MFNQLSVFVTLLWVSATLHAEGAFDTGWGRAFDSSAYGQLFFTLMQVFGIWACIRALLWMVQYANHQQTKRGYGKCTGIFIAGCLLFYAHESINVIYNTF